MDAEPPKEDCSPAQPAPTPQTKSKRPSQALYVPKKQLQGSKDKVQSVEGDKPRPRPRYTDKNRKNAKNKKDKATATAADSTDPVGGDEGQDGDGKSDVKEERPQEAEVQVNQNSDSTGLANETSSQLEAASPHEEQSTEENWDTLFNDDGDCLDPHLLEEVSAWCTSGSYTQRNMHLQLAFGPFVHTQTDFWVTVTGSCGKPFRKLPFIAGVQEARACPFCLTMSFMCD